MHAGVCATLTTQESIGVEAVAARPDVVPQRQRHLRPQRSFSGVDEQLSSSRPSRPPSGPTPRHVRCPLAAAEWPTPSSRNFDTTSRGFRSISRHHFPITREYTRFFPQLPPSSGVPLWITAQRVLRTFVPDVSDVSYERGTYTRRICAE